MTALAFGEFNKRLDANMKEMWRKIVKNQKFELAKEVDDWDGETKLSEGIKLSGLSYKKPVPDGNGGTKFETYYVYAKNSVNAQEFVNKIHQLVPFKGKGKSPFVATNFKPVLDDERTTIPLGRLHKAKEFGGGSTSLDMGMIKWGHLGYYADICNFTPLPPGKQIELYWLNDLNQLISETREKLKDDPKTEGMCLDLIVAGKTIQNVIGVMGAPGAKNDPKADIVFVTCSGDCMEMTGYTSLKDGTGPKDFQQWGGLSKYKEDPYVKKFAEDVLNLYPKGISAAGGKVNIGREIEDEDISIKAIYGPEYKRGVYGSDSCQFVIQGSPLRLQKTGNAYKLITSGGQYSDDVADQRKLLTGGTQPALMARADSKRGDFDIPGTRMFIFSKAGRTDWTWI